MIKAYTVQYEHKKDKIMENVSLHEIGIKMLRIFFFFQAPYKFPSPKTSLLGESREEGKKHKLNFKYQATAIEKTAYRTF